MSKSKQLCNIKSIAINKLIAHPDNPNRISRGCFLKLVRNIERTGLYEPLVVRPHRQKAGCYELINGHHRCKALEQLGYKQANCVVWDVDDKQVDIFLTTLNRLSGADLLDKKAAIFKRLTQRMQAGELGKLLPQTAKQIERLGSLKRPAVPVKTSYKDFANPMVFFVSDSQQKIIEEAFSDARPFGKTRAESNATALTNISQYYIDNHSKEHGYKP